MEMQRRRHMEEALKKQRCRDEVNECPELDIRRRKKREPRKQNDSNKRSNEF